MFLPHFFEILRSKNTSPITFLDFSKKNIEKVWDIEKICNIAKFRKIKAKNDKVPTFFYVKVFRWTGLRSLPIPARKVLNVQKLKSN